MMKKEYETPKMSSIDFEYKTSLLAGSCDPSGAETRSNVIFGLNLVDITNPKA